ncbi:phage tail protein [Caldalkalibacillus mannanilyticus]|uniref:phage tail protein n=1 Tax=Caldalkalibacillus mannanilyticus TaxID=1418 RepID=UPI000468E367|nr:hypothetical protein [Caldalkalibacillus mannanilyticus]
MKLFSLVGSIFIDNKEAKKNLDDVNQKAEGTKSKLDAVISKAAKFGVSLANFGNHAMGLVNLIQLFGSLSINNKAVTKSLDEINQKTDGTKSKLGELISSASNFGSGLAGVGGKALGFMTAAAGMAVQLGTAVVSAGQTMFELAQKSSQAASDIDKMSQSTSISRERLQELKFVTSQVQVDFDAVQGSTDNLKMVMNAASDETSKASSIFKEMQISLDDGNGSMKTAGQVWDEAVQHLAGMENEVERNALAFELFGDSANELFPLFDQGTEGLDQLSQKAHELGLVMSEDAIAANLQFAEAFDQVQMAVEAVMLKLGTAFLPILQSLLDWVLENMPQIQELIGKAFDYIAIVVNQVASILQEYVLPIFSQLLAWVVENMPQIEQVVTQVFDFISQIVQQAVGVFQEHLLPIFKEIFDWAMAQMPLFQEIFISVFEAIGSIIENFVTLAKLTWDLFGEFIMNATRVVFEGIKLTIQGALKIVQGIISSVCSLITGDLDKLGKGLLSIWNGMWEAIVGLILVFVGPILVAFSTVGEMIAGWFTRLKDDAVQWGKNMIQGFIDGIKAMASRVADAVGEVINQAKQYIGFNSPAEKGEGRHIVEWGANMIDGFLDGVKSMKPEVEHVMNATIGSMKPQMSGGAVASPSVVIDRGAFEGAMIMDDYGVDRLMDRIMERFEMGVRK